MSQVNFTNSRAAPMFVAYMRLDNNCQNECGEPWDVLGWINLQPGQTTSRDNPTNNRYFYYYAEATDGSVGAVLTPQKCRMNALRNVRALV